MKRIEGKRREIIKRRATSILSRGFYPKQETPAGNSER